MSLFDYAFIVFLFLIILILNYELIHKLDIVKDNIYSQVFWNL